MKVKLGSVSSYTKYLIKDVSDLTEAFSYLRDGNIIKQLIDLDYSFITHGYKGKEIPLEKQYKALPTNIIITETPEEEWKYEIQLYDYWNE